MSRGSVLRTVGRVTALGLVLLAMAGPWAFDIHADEEQDCPPPLVWLGEGRCACRISLATLLDVSVKWGDGSLLALLLLPGLPLLSTLLLLGRERRWKRALHLAAWGLVAAFSLLAIALWWHAHGALSLRLWGSWLCAGVALAALGGEIAAARWSTPGSAPITGARTTPRPISPPTMPR